MKPLVGMLGSKGAAPLVRLLRWMLLLMSVCGAALPIVAHAALPSYFFADFESGGGWPIGALTKEGSALRVIQGTASVIVATEPDSMQILELGPSNPFPAIFVDSSVLGKAPHVFCELLVRPFAVAGDTDEEFIDFGGAILGFFRVGDRGEFRALSGRSKDESVWISTGAGFALETDGTAASWIRVTLHLNRDTQRWDVRVNGQELLAGVRATAGASSTLALWLYGHAEARVLYDDLLITTVEPDHLEKILAARSGPKRLRTQQGMSVTGPKIVTSTKARTELRHEQAPMKKAQEAPGTPDLRGWNMTFENGGNTYKPGPIVEVDGEKMAIMAHGISTDENGNVLPGTLVLTADAELQPGTDLSKIRWLVCEANGPHEMGEVMAAGDFSTGLVQTVTRPPEWMKRACLARVWVPPAQADVLWSKAKLK